MSRPVAVVSVAVALVFVSLEHLPSLADDRDASQVEGRGLAGLDGLAVILKGENQ
jgi:hypothetical protein